MRLLTKAAALAALAVPLRAAAQDQGLPALPIVGAPAPRGTGFQPSATELARDVVWLDSLLLVIISAITVFVLVLLLLVILRYNRGANPTPARFTHNSALEVTWTVVPIVILVVIGAFSLPILFKQQEIPEADVTIKVTGLQWFWTYEYVDHGFEFSSFMLPREELEAHGYSQSEYLLATDTAMVVPVGKTVVVQTTGADVIHSWTVPAFGVKQDAVPGRLGQLWFKAEREGVFFGQCSELCGKDHAYMPITVKVVRLEDYEAWLDRAIAEYGGTPRTTSLAQAN